MDRVVEDVRGVITGTIEHDKIDSLRTVPGVADVEPDREIRAI
jgi:hypothetical protein